METSLFIFLILQSPWPIIFSIMLFYSSIRDPSLPLSIYSKKQLYKYIRYVVMYLCVFCYIFFFRLWRNNRVVDILLGINNFLEFSETIENSSLILFGLFGTIWIIFFFCLIRWLTILLKKVLLALFLYLKQYNLFCHSVNSVRIHVLHKFMYFFADLTYKYTKNIFLTKVITEIWPVAIFHLEAMVFKLLMPYLWIFDIMTNFGKIEKIFLVLPWYYIYSLVRGFFVYWEKIDTVSAISLSFKKYGFYDITKKKKC